MRTSESIRPDYFRAAVAVIREIGDGFMALWFGLVPRKLLETYVTNLIKKYYFQKIDRVAFYKSGRSALTALFQAISLEGQENVVLLPDYICNVVYLAFERAGASIISYPTDELFHPDMQQVEKLLAQMPVRAVLFASIFGSKNNQMALLQRVRHIQPEIIVVFDECQNFETHSAIHLDTHAAMVISFNDKTIPGVMGGAICLPPDTSIRLKTPEQSLNSKVIHDLNIGMMLFKRVARKITLLFDLHKTHSFSLAEPKYEFSQAVLEPYNTEVGEISKLSLGYAWLGLRRLPDLEAGRKQNSIQLRRMLKSTNDIHLLDTEGADISPYLPAWMMSSSVFKSSGLYLKRPYALHNHEKASLRPNMFCVINNPDIRLKDPPSKG